MVAASKTMGNSDWAEPGVGSVGSIDVPGSVVPVVLVVNLKV